DKISQPPAMATIIQPMTSFWLAAKITATIKAITTTSSTTLVSRKPRRCVEDSMDCIANSISYFFCRVPIGHRHYPVRYHTDPPSSQRNRSEEDDRGSILLPRTRRQPGVLRFLPHWRPAPPESSAPHHLGWATWPMRRRQHLGRRRRRCGSCPHRWFHGSRPHPGSPRRL